MKLFSSLSTLTALLLAGVTRAKTDAAPSTMRRFGWLALHVKNFICSVLAPAALTARIASFLSEPSGFRTSTGTTTTGRASKTTSVSIGTLQ